MPVQKTNAVFSFSTQLDIGHKSTCLLNSVYQNVLDISIKEKYNLPTYRAALPLDLLR
jgi:hypothetical protein